jgi:hypothetical protein
LPYFKAILVRGEVFRALQAEPEWLEKVNAAVAAGSIAELEMVLRDFARTKGVEIIEVPLK